MLIYRYSYFYINGYITGLSAIPITVPMPFFAELEKNNILESEQNPTVTTKDMYYVSNLYKI